MKKLPQRSLCAVLSLQLLLSACSATAPVPAEAGPTPPYWAQRQTTVWPGPQPLVRMQPNFQAPSAQHCTRPIQTREVPGRVAGQDDFKRNRVDRHERSGGIVAPLEGRAAAGAVAAAPPAPPISRPAAKAEAESSLADTSKRSWPSPAAVAPSPAPLRESLQPPRQSSPVVTAGMVDDNANFSEYLAFRQRTRVTHLPRDISERYLLEVRDARGHGVADAEVVVQSANGHAMWARTDTAGKVWLHPNAFDPARASVYDVAVRKDGRQASTVFQRGQKSAVEVVLDSRTAPARARLDLVFLVDATGSMADEIDKLKATLQTIANEVAALPSQPDLCFGLVAYRDKDDAFLLRSHDLTNDLDAFQGVLNALHAAGGGDYPEAMNEALHDTVHKLSWRGDGATRLVFLLADAPPHLDYGGPQYDDDMLAALGKGIKIFGVGASGLDQQGEYIQRQIAQYTGGRFVFLTYDKARVPTSGPGRETVHDVRNYSVDTLDRLIVRLVGEELGKLQRGG
jgi:Mg-chelatase subunit ChlD